MIIDNEFIHPFSDGNGRIRRLWQSVFFLFYQFRLLLRDYQEEYYKAIDESQKSNYKSNLKVLLLIQKNKNITIKELCEILSIKYPCIE